MINPLVLSAFKKSVQEKLASEKNANLAHVLAGGALLGGGALALGLGKNVYRDMQYGRAERLEETSKRLRAQSAANQMGNYNPYSNNMGGH